jgi:hypothetical protein
MWKKTNAYRIVTGKPEGTLWSPRSRWENDIQKNIIAIRLIGLIRPAYGQVVGSCEHGTELLVSIIRGIY